MTESIPPGAVPAHPVLDGPSYPPNAYTTAVPADLTHAPPASWKRWFVLSAAGGVVAGLGWWLAAPGGGIWGSPTDYQQWLARDLVLAGWCALAGLVAGLILVRSGAKDRTVVLARFGALIVGGLLGSVIAWRLGVLGGDLFQTPPPNMSHPSMVFSLRAAPILLVWPMVSALVVFVWSFINYGFGPAAAKREL